ncbi:MAG: 50S ribosomal protein L15 [Chloroflexi bacterium]|nr:MAG: 50S ribosomal protein L15 [Chloroflexota bacterium]
MEQHTLRQSPGAKQVSKRVGRGPGSGQGTYAGRGRKGQKARNKVHAQFEGGQMPLVRRLGHKRGFRNFTRVEFQAVSLTELGRRFEAGAIVDGTSLAAVGLIDAPTSAYKVLASGSIEHALIVTAPRFSEAAKAAIIAAGGTCDETAPAEHRVRNRIHRRKAAAAAAVGAAVTPEQGA